jgi:hypothetical protein
MLLVDVLKRSNRVVVLDNSNSSAEGNDRGHVELEVSFARLLSRSERTTGIDNVS